MMNNDNDLISKTPRICLINLTDGFSFYGIVGEGYSSLMASTCPRVFYYSFRKTPVSFGRRTIVDKPNKCK